MMSHLLNAWLGALVLLLVFAVSMGIDCRGRARRRPAAASCDLFGAGLVQLPGDPA